MTVSNEKNVENFLGQLIIDETKRLSLSQFIDLDSIETKELFIIANEMMDPVFTVESLFMKHNRQVVIKCIELAMKAAKKGSFYG